MSIRDAYRDYLAHLTDITVEYVVGGDEQAMQTRLSQLTILSESNCISSDYWRRQNGKTFKVSAERVLITVRAAAYWHRKWRWGEPCQKQSRSLEWLNYMILKLKKALAPAGRRPATKRL